MQEPRQPQQLEPRIVRAPLIELTIYDVSEAELEAIERGGPESLYLNFGVFFMSTAISLTVTLTTTDIKSDRLHAGFLIVTIVSYAVFLVLGGLWYRGMRSKKKVISCIRSRRPATGESLSLPSSQ